ncbi:carbohydrate ABC transporter permease [Cognatishimia sp. SS12]|uniref:carbohydrate ABC transporter permease n=1 Tax=Cognatishimia sp. SS12 TaxID=2979465 RepID=UPI00232ECA67|nr:carbohydrate ABC transporter permease [Cognatishimia sp. SS12]MDC0736745.1 carbohydrate ABC transporter permease [Cognatishimia sp. SS12]
MTKAKPLDHLILILGSLFMLGPAIFLAASALQNTQGFGGWAQPFVALFQQGDLFGNGVSALQLLKNSFVLALGVAGLKTALSMLAAFALVYFRLRHATLVFGVILLSMFFPVETRVLPTFLTAHQLGLTNSYAGMILPVVASGLGTLLFRQYFQQVPSEMQEAARMDGAGPMRFFWDILLPLARPMILGLFAILFVMGWNQYVWPLVINVSSEAHYTIVRGIERMGRGSSDGMVLALVAILPPGLVMLLAQRGIARGLGHTLH